MKPTCLAFPQGIPNEILQLGYDHRQPIDGDNGIMFVPAEGVSNERVEAAAAPPPTFD